MSFSFDHELYNAWMEEHRNLKGKCLGAPGFVFDQKTGMCLRIVYENPAIEAQEAIRRFFQTLRELTPAEQFDADWEEMRKDGIVR